MGLRIVKGGAIQPSRGDVHVNRPLTNISIAYLQDAADFVADRVFPLVRSDKRSDKYFTIPRGSFLRREMKPRAPGTESAGVNYTIGQDTFFCEVFGLHVDLNDQVLANYDSPLNADREATELLTQQALMDRELAWVTKYFGPSKGWKDVTGVSGAPGGNQFKQWNDDAATPIEDVRAGKRYIQKLTGRRPNKLTLSREVYDQLVDHPSIVARLDRGQTTGPALVLRQAVAALFELEEILVMDAIYNTAAEGATDAFDWIAGKHALLTYSPKTPGIMTPSAGYTFGWTGYAGAEAYGMRMKKFRIEHLESDRVEIAQAYDQKQVAGDLGYSFNSAVA